MSTEVVFQIDSYRVLDWVNQITVIHNQILKGENFSAGFNLCFLQQCMIEIYKDLERQEKLEKQHA